MAQLPCVWLPVLACKLICLLPVGPEARGRPAARSLAAAVRSVGSGGQLEASGQRSAKLLTVQLWCLALWALQLQRLPAGVAYLAAPVFRQWRRAMSLSPARLLTAALSRRQLWQHFGTAAAAFDRLAAASAFLALASRPCWQPARQRLPLGAAPPAAGTRRRPAGLRPGVLCWIGYVSGSSGAAAHRWQASPRCGSSVSAAQGGVCRQEPPLSHAVHCPFVHAGMRKVWLSSCHHR